jgi:hypothetical protein
LMVIWRRLPLSSMMKRPLWKKKEPLRISSILLHRHGDAYTAAQAERINEIHGSGRSAAMPHATNSADPSYGLTCTSMCP